MSIDWDTWDCKCGAYGAGPDNHECPLKDYGGPKKRLEEARSQLTNEKAFFTVTGWEHIEFLIAQLESAWQREAVAREALETYKIIEELAEEGARPIIGPNLKTATKALAKMESIK